MYKIRMEREQKYVDACVVGDIDKIVYMIKNEDKAFKNCPFLNKCMRSACEGGYLDIFNILHQYRDITLVENSYLYDMMLCACRKGHIEIINRLVKIPTYNYYIKVNEMWQNGLYGACLGGRIDIFKLYEKQVSYDKYFMKRCLDRACESGNINLVRYIMNKPEIGKLCTDGINVCLQNACLSNSLEIINIFIDNGATNWEEGLGSACSRGHVEIAELMITKGAKNLNTCLYEACQCGHIEIIKLLVSKGASDWDRGLKGACKGGHINIVEYMINKGATDWNGGFLSAGSGGHIEIIKYIAARSGSDIFGDGWVNRFIYYMCFYGDLEFINMITPGTISEHDVNMGLILACAGGHPCIVKTMIQYGATYNDYGLLLNETHNVEISYILINQGCREIYKLRHSTDLRLYTMYCKFSKIPLKGEVYEKLLNDHPPYVLFIGSRVEKCKCHIKKIPAELFVLLFRY